MADFPQTGIELLAKDAQKFIDDVNNSGLAVKGFTDTASEAADKSDGFGEIVTGALRRVGEAAVNFLGEAIGQVGEFGKGILEAAMDYEDHEQRLTRLLASTNGASGLTIERARELTTQFMDLAGGSDETGLAIMEMGIRMGTVTADQMPQFIQTSLDLAETAGVDATQAARLLAQAIDDPASAMMRFNRMGIRFDTGLQEQIKSLVKAGKSSEAYQLMINRVGEATSGAALGASKTLSGQIELLKGRFDEATETIGLALLPAFSGLFEGVLLPMVPTIEKLTGGIADFVTTAIVPLFTKLGEGLKYLTGGTGVITGFSDLQAGIEEFGGPFGFLSQAFGIELPDIFTQVDALVMQLVDTWDNALLPALQTAWAWIQTELIPLFQQIWDILLTGASEAIPQLVTFWNMTLLPALQNFWAWVQANLFPLLAEFWAWFKVNLPIAVQTLVDFYVNVLLPAFIQVYTWIIANLIPILGQVWSWLQTNIPIAIQTLSNFWTGTLLPAINTVWAWITGTLVPLLQQLWSWLQTNIPIALQTLSDFWQTVLLPAIMAVWSWMSTVLFPFFAALAEFFGAVFDVAITASAGLWQNVLYPAVEAVGKFFEEHILPVLTSIANFVVATFTPAFQALSKFLSDTFAGVLETIRKAFDAINVVIGSITSALRNMADKINNLQLPSWLTPGSPTPFELGLRGIAAALADVNAQLPTMDTNINAVGQSAGQTVNNMQSYSNTNQYYYSPNYGSAPHNPSQDFAIMQVMAG